METSYDWFTLIALCRGRGFVSMNDCTNILSSLYNIYRYLCYHRRFKRIRGTNFTRTQFRGTRSRLRRSSHDIFPGRLGTNRIVDKSTTRRMAGLGRNLHNGRGTHNRDQPLYCSRHILDILRVATVTPAINQVEYHVGSQDIDKVIETCSDFILGLPSCPFHPCADHVRTNQAIS